MQAKGPCAALGLFWANPEVTETLTLQVVKFAIGKVECNGRCRVSFNEPTSAAACLSCKGGTPHFHALAVQTALAVTTTRQADCRSGLKPRRQPLIDALPCTCKRGAAALTSGRSCLLTTGSASTGRDRLSLVGSHANLFERDHQLSVAYTTSLAGPSDVRARWA